jgi:gamma-glutamylcyclotransferase (GGCT)/AIG2-like uncharacterized protein YtfP
MAPPKTIYRSSTSSLFVYGTLMSPEVVNVLLGRVPPHEPAVLRGDFARHPVRSRVYPGMVFVNSRKNEGAAAVHGLLYSQLSPSEMERLDWFEGDTYKRIDVTVETVADGNRGSSSKPLVTVNTYVWSNPIDELDVSQDWSYNHFRTQYLERFLQDTVQECRDELERLGL